MFQSGHRSRGALVASALTLFVLAFSGSLALATILNDPFVSLTGDSGRFGVSVASGADLGGDMQPDVVVGAYTIGRVYVFFSDTFAEGMEISALDADLTITGPAGSRFGISVALADVNNDNAADIIVGADHAAQGIPGKAYVFFGPHLEGDISAPSADLTLVDDGSTDTRFGTSVAAGDFNHDNYDDVIVGAYNSNRAFIFFGEDFAPGLHTVPSSDADVKLVGNEAGDFGWSVGSVGDVDGNGNDDAIVGAIAYDQSLMGRTYVFLGEGFTPGITLFASNADIKCTGGSNDQLGFSVAAAGDVGGSSYPDFLVGAAPASQAHLFFGGDTPDGVPDLSLSGNAGDALGESVASAGDYNGDGYGDFIVGLGTNNDGPTPHPGRAHIYYGGPELDSLPDVVLEGEERGDGFGGAVASAGDINGDGFDDVVVGAMWNAGQVGRAYVYLGNPGMLGRSWDATSLQNVLDDEYGAGVINAATDYEGSYPKDGDPAYWQDDQLQAVIVREIAGFGGSNVLGWYEEAAAPVIDGVDDGVIFEGPMSQGETATVVFPGGVIDFGFYLNPNGTGDSNNAPEPELFFTNRLLNDIGPDGIFLHTPSDGDPQCLIYNISHLLNDVPTYVLAWEELDYGGEVTPSPSSTGTDNDFQDLVVEVTEVYSPVPAVSASLEAVDLPAGIELTWRVLNVHSVKVLRLLRAEDGDSARVVAAWTREAAFGRGTWTDEGVVPGLLYRYQLLADIDGQEVSSAEIEIARASSYRARSQLLGNAPNPFNPMTEIRFTLSNQQDVELRVYDSSGRLVRILDPGVRSAGINHVLWDGQDQRGRPVASGSYSIRLVADDVADEMRVTLIR